MKKKALNLKIFTLNLALIAFFTFISINPAKSTLCAEKASKTECSKGLANYPLFDTPYKTLANYLPILALRAIAHGNVYKNKKSFKLERYYYVKNTSGAFQEPYAKLLGSGEVKGHGFLGRKISFTGKLNDFDLKYENKMSFSLPKKAKMDVTAELDGIRFLKLEVKSDGDKMTNDVEGTFFNKEVKYHTEHRDTSGVLAGIPYKIFTEGRVKEPDNFLAVTDGTIGSYRVTGSANLTSHNKYISTEHYGPIMVKTFIAVID